VARSVILLDPTGMSGIEYGIQLMGVGIIVVGLGAGYYLIKKAGLYHPLMKHRRYDKY
jgi:hypothetical protein